jgi:transposase InsO family protein
MVKVQLLDRIYSPALDQSIVEAITECGQCKNFGAKHIQSLLEPITRRHPFELMVGDTLSMPRGKGGFHKLALEMDTYSQRLWAKPLATAASGNTTVTRLRKLWTDFHAPESYMCDNGLEFDNAQLQELCDEFGVELHYVAAYSPWVNGLVEGMNAKLLGRLKRMCAPDLGEDKWDAMGWEDLPANWPEHLEAAVLTLNNQILPVLKFSPDELLFGLVINTAQTPLEDSVTAVDEADAGAADGIHGPTPA